MKVELSNRELKDIYNGLIVFTTHELCYISQMEQEENREEDKELLKFMKEKNERQMILINKIEKLID
ncbi:hypothetical protein FDC45_15805 [Clostridium botulinum]|uniref:Uncharacterized protein n=1 Tax=Clostridium botulinum TaxID=1491 RepID=A0A846J8P9_CLOBO|nr:hypothetical protein [Clostridium botulinum]ACA57536.1 hypothetical protein CLK_A0168 [Clostridium botulinum A3 str. Loch Maree]NFH65006.1 hypothetical protein [Clostridium botulinum]NFJ09541.1 hypothetical protein [Clostridium botulinum]NFK16510.1 hypothetical protein [Clostridium botulinum]NFM93475.1 hypothetical protein [Clostridium botulinum]